MWGAAIRAAARAALWRVIQKHRLATGRVPIAIEFDEIGYLGTDPDPRVNAPAADNGRLGALKSAGYLELTDDPAPPGRQGRIPAGQIPAPPAVLGADREPGDTAPVTADATDPAAAPAPTRGQAARAITTSLADPRVSHPSVT